MPNTKKKNYCYNKVWQNLGSKFNPKVQEWYLKFLYYFLIPFFPSFESSYVSPGEFFYYTEESKNFIPFPPAQRWFLIQSRYCVRCGYVHFREHWVRIPAKANI